MGQNMILSFKDCTVVFNEKTLFQPEWGIYDMAVGQEIVSVFSGVADKDIYTKKNTFVPSEKTHKINYNQHQRNLHHLYQRVRDVREKQVPKSEIPSIWNELKQYKRDWLCAIELLEVSDDKKVNEEILYFLKNNKDKTTAHLIDDGINRIQ